MPVNGTTWAQRYESALMNTFGPPKLVLTEGTGAIVRDESGREYLDLLGGIAVNTLGHNHPALVGAVTEQIARLGHVSNFFATPQQIGLAEKLNALLNAGIAQQGGEPVETRTFLANSGSEANEAAFKLTRRTGRTHIVAAEEGFHGRTMGALAVTHKPAYREPFEPLPGDITFVPYGDADALRAAVTDRTAAVVLEPIQGEAGAVVPPADYLAAAREITTAHGALLWIDEVQTGVARTGSWFAHQASGVAPVVPDVITLAKGLAGGIPIGACLAVGGSGKLFDPGNHGTTFGGNPLAAAAALAVIGEIENADLRANALAVGAILAEGLAGDQRVTGVTGRGLLIGVALASANSADVVAAAQDAGFIINATRPDRIRLAPPLILTRQQAERFIAAWPGILDAAEGAS